MEKAPDFDLEVAHKYFAAHCFNRAWDLIDKTDRTVEDDRMMVLLNQASLFHWSQRADSDNKSKSIGYWQASRIQLLLGNASEARRYAEICLEHSHALDPFYLGYAYEALARAAQFAGEDERCRDYLSRAAEQAKSVARKEDRALLENDLASMR